MEIPFTPVDHFIDDGCKRLAVFGEMVLNLYRSVVGDLPFNELLFLSL